MKSNIFPGLLMAAIGLLLLIIPNQIVRVIVIVLGAEAIVNGVFNLVTMRTLMADESFQFAILIRSIVSMVVGLLAICLPLLFAEVMWRIMIYVLGIYLLFAAVIELYAVAKLRETDIPRRQYVLEAIISVIAALILFAISPHSQIGTVLLRVIGTIAILIGAVYLYVAVRNHIAQKKDTIVATAVVEDDA
ncbi:MAG: DUF308 domain-containing protein [Treponema sp.]|nr:DUF308 domain-containing protein [Treponema sp.]